MTISEYLLKYMEDRGLWPNQSKAILESIKTSEDLDMMAHRWDDAVEDYTTPLLSALLCHVSSAALAWIDANLPNHFARSLFAPLDQRS